MQSKTHAHITTTEVKFCLGRRAPWCFSNGQVVILGFLFLGLGPRLDSKHEYMYKYEWRGEEAFKLGGADAAN